MTGTGCPRACSSSRTLVSTCPMNTCLPLFSKSKISILTGRSMSPLHSSAMGILHSDQTGLRLLSTCWLRHTTDQRPSSFCREISRKGSDFEKKPSLFASFCAENVVTKLSRVLDRLSAWTCSTPQPFWKLSMICWLGERISVARWKVTPPIKVCLSRSRRGDRPSEWYKRTMNCPAACQSRRRLLRRRAVLPLESPRSCSPPQSTGCSWASPSRSRHPVKLTGRR